MYGEDGIDRRQVLKVVGGASVGVGLTGTAAGSPSGDTDSTVSAASRADTEQCGTDAVWQEEWRDIEEGGEQVHMLERQTEFQCPVTVQFDIGPLNLDAYLTLDGRTPTKNDYDRYTDQPMEGGGFTVEGSRLDPGDELGVLVVGIDVPEDPGGGDDPEPPGDYLTILNEETDEVVAPAANVELVTETPTEGETVEFDGSSSFARLGSLQSYEWSYERSLGGDTGEGTGETFSFEPSDEGQYTVTLTVTDEFGRSESTQKYISVEGSGGFCFITTATAREGETLDSLRRFRDGSMATTPLGRGLVGLYYRISPPVARAMARHPYGRTSRLCRWYVGHCAALSDRKRELDSRPASAALGGLITTIYALGLLIAMTGYVGIRLSELL